MSSLPVDCRFKRLAGFAALLASLTPLTFLQEKQAASSPYSHGTMTCLGEKNTPGIRLFLTPTNGCRANPYPRLEIEIREMPIAVPKSIVIGPDNFAFRCLNVDESCEQIPRGKVVFEHLENVQQGGLKSRGRYELTLRGGAKIIEMGGFVVDCLIPCSEE
jgi:hypothetical protein